MPKHEVAGTTVRIQPLWARVDQNRTKLATFVALFVFGSAVLLTAALVVVPGSLLSLVLSDGSGVYWRQLAVVVGIAFAAMLAVGALLAAIQLSNAEDWVRNRFAGRAAEPGEFPALQDALADMTLAAGLGAQPSLVVLETPGVNAYALGTARTKATIGITRGFLDELSADEQRAVLATLIARIIAGDILFGTALAALMGPLKAIRESHASAGGAAEGLANAGCGDPGCTAHSCGGCGDIGDLGDSDGCGGAIAMIVFVVVVAIITYLAVVTAAWLVTLWGRALQRTTYEKADAEGMLLLKDPAPMLSALSKSVQTSNEVGVADPSYDGIFYAMTAGTSRVEKVEQRRYRRLREVLGTDGLAAPEL